MPKRPQNEAGGVILTSDNEQDEPVISVCALIRRGRREVEGRFRSTWDFS